MGKFVTTVSGVLRISEDARGTYCKIKKSMTVPWSAMVVLGGKIRLQYN